MYKPIGLQTYIKNLHQTGFNCQKCVSQNDKKSKNAHSQFNINYSLRRAFTLAEILITLAVIGIVAALTIHVLINNVQEAQYKTAYKKAYSVISQAFLTASKNDDFVAMTGQYSYIGAEVNFAALQSQFKIIKQCTNASLGCWNTSGESWRQEDSTAPAFIDSSGMAWKLRYHDTVGLVPAILVDTNGSKAPNQYGEDRFVFLFSCYSFFIWAPPDDMGIPTKIIPFSDITNPPASDFIINCPSVAKHACYNTSWLLGN